MPKRTKARRVARRSARSRRSRSRSASATATVTAPARSRHQQLVELLLLRERTTAIIESWVLEAQLALFTGDRRRLAKCLRHLGNPDLADVVGRVLDVRMSRQLQLVRLRGWSHEQLEEFAPRALGEEPARLGLLLDALAERAQRSGPARVDDLSTAIFVDLWLAIVSLYEPTDRLELPRLHGG